MTLKNLSIKSKLIRIYSATIILALLLAGGSFIVQDIYTFKEALTQRVKIQAKIISSNAAIAIVFKDQESTQEILNALEADPEILSAQVIKDNIVFSRYSRAPSVTPKSSWFLNFFIDPWLKLEYPIQLQNKQIASLEIISDYPTLHSHINQYGSITGLVLFSAFIISFLIALRMQNFFLYPIEHLVAITKKVADDKNYSIKVNKISNDEMGILTDNFNTMLRQINIRDKNLEAEVENRTNELLELNKTLKYRANHDALTKLANRDFFNERVQQAIDHAERESNIFAILFLDIDQFKLINDSMGHEFGDLILCMAADRLKRCVRKVDTLARMGGDEFTILLHNIGSPENAITFAKKILKEFNQPFTEKGHDFHVKPSIGISIFPEDGQFSEILQKNADTAMYAAKAEGGNNYHFFSREMSDKIHKRLTLEAELHKALHNDELLLYYQPQLDNQDNTVGFEALIRWNHPGKGMIPPFDFIPIAEETGQIIDIGQWVVEQACRQQIIWRNQGYNLVPIHINISPKQFIEPNLAQHIHSALEKYQLQPHLIGCEVTENTFARDVDQSVKILTELNQYGYSISIDDFGTGYSSLGYLQKFPISCLKIDQSFIRDLTLDNKDAALVEGIINLAHSLDLPVVAEGVETSEHQKFLVQNGCDILQGYYFSKPLPADEAVVWFKPQNKEVASATSEAIGQLIAPG